MRRPIVLRRIREHLQLFNPLAAIVPERVKTSFATPIVDPCRVQQTPNGVDLIIDVASGILMLRLDPEPLERIDP